MLIKRYRRIITVLGSGAAILLASLGVSRPLPCTQNLHGEVLNEKNAPLPDAVCTLTGSLLPVGGLTATADRKGQFEFMGLAPGEYTLLCGASGYQPLKRTVEVADTPPPLHQIVLPAEVVI